MKSIKAYLTPKNLSFREALIHKLLLLGSIMTLIFFVSNLILQLNWLLNLSTFIVFLILITALFISYKKQIYYEVAYIIYFLLYFILYPLLWVTNAGLNGPTLIIFLLNTVIVSVIFDHRRFKVLFPITIIIPFVLIIIELIYPSFIISTGTQNQITVDIIITFISVCGFLGLIIRNFFQEYFKTLKFLKLTKENLYQETITDHMTGLKNRRFIFKVLNNILCANVYPIGILLFDIDDFKDINDNYSHLTGDEALVELGQFLKDKIRETDYIGRYGGEEFIVVFPNTQVKKLIKRINILRQEISKQQWTKNKINFTISGGLYFVYNCESIESALKMADQGLYKAKNSGKNKIILMNSETK